MYLIFKTTTSDKVGKPELHLGYFKDKNSAETYCRIAMEVLASTLGETQFERLDCPEYRAIEILQNETDKR